jgi:hypothetical protein
MAKNRRTRQSRNTVRRRTNRMQTTRRKSRGRKVTGRTSRRYRGGRGGKCRRDYDDCKFNAHKYFGPQSYHQSDDEKHLNKTKHLPNALARCKADRDNCRRDKGTNRVSFWRRALTTNPQTKKEASNYDEYGHEVFDV